MEGNSAKCTVSGKCLIHVSDNGMAICTTLWWAASGLIFNVDVISDKISHFLFVHMSYRCMSAEQFNVVISQCCMYRVGRCELFSMCPSC